jgi:hypothetical protein
MAVIRPLKSADFEAALRLNNGAVPHVNELNKAELSDLADEAAVAHVGERDGAIVALLIALRPGAAYGSLNYGWFSQHYDDFLYVDRIVIDGAARGSGLGRTLYEDLIRRSAGQTARIVCEVNEEPPNPGSLAFHQAMGFTAVGRQHWPQQGKRVVMLAKDL